MEVISHYLPGRLKNMGKVPQSEQPISRPRFEHGTFWIQNRSPTHQTVALRVMILKLLEYLRNIFQGYLHSNYAVVNIFISTLPLA
jgi:hypothetical protein